MKTDRKKKNTHKPYGPYERLMKRPLDCMLSFTALTLLSPFLLLVALLIRIKLGSPVIFKQHRIGRNDKEFSLYKFRSMTNERDEKGIFLPDDQRITKFGSFIRRTSIDELPSLVNILKGDMAVIGPRPLPTRYLNRYNEVQRRRHELRPGLSNPATVNGRNAQSWEQQFEGDVWYVDHISFFVDLKSIFQTLRVVFDKEGITAADGGARGEFIGIAKPEDLKTDSEGNYMKL